MSPNPRFILSRAGPSDMEEIIDLCYDSFSRAGTTLFMGCPDRTNIPKYRQRCLDIMETDKSDVWMQVREAETGKLVAGSDWKVYVNGKPDDVGDRPIEWVEGKMYEASKRQTEVMNENRWRSMTGPFVRM